MTLLETLARQWPFWDGCQRTYQTADGELIASEGYCFQYPRGKAPVASDHKTAIVTQEKWETARKAFLNGNI